MADVAYTARASTRDLVYDSIMQLDLPKDANGNFTHNAITTFITGLNRQMKSQFNLIGEGEGMKPLLDKTSDISKIKSTDTANYLTVLRASKREAEEETKKTNDGTVIQPTFSTRTDAQEEADRLNQIYQAVIGAKEGATKAIIEKVGTDITDSVIRTIDGTDYKGIDDYQLSELVDAAIQGAARPATSDILTLLNNVVSHTFDFQKRVSHNVELLKARAAKLAAYGVNVDETHLVLVTMANVEAAAKEEYGSEFRPALRTLRRTFTYNHKHDATSFETILKALAEADEVRNLKDAPPPSEHQANALSDSMSYLTKLMQDTMVEEDATTYSGYETANAATSDSDSSYDTKRSKKKSKKKKKKDTKKSKGRKSEERTSYKDNPCKHCRKFKCRKQHKGLSEDKCFWNKKYNGWRPKSICDEMEIPFKPRHKFPDSDASSSEGESD